MPYEHTAKNPEVEAALRKARLAETARLKALREQLKPKIPTYGWVNPELHGRPWSVICLAREVPGGDAWPHYAGDAAV